MKYLFALIALIIVVFPSIVLADDECEEGNQNVTVTVQIIQQSPNNNCYGCSGNGYGSYYVQHCEPPEISNLMVTNITDESATISWATNKRCKGRVWYAEFASYENMQYTAWNEENLLYHEFTINDLNDNMRYAYQAIVEDECGIRRSDVFKFTTEKYIIPVEKSSSKTSEPEVDNSDDDIILGYTPLEEPRTFNWILLYWILGIIVAVSLLYILGWSIFKLYHKMKAKNIT